LDTLPRIFIGGVGRSGTTILYDAMRTHEQVYALPKEMRLLLDPDGLINLVDALTYRYSVIQAREAKYRFERLMKVYFTTPDQAPYRSYDFPAWLGGDYYWNRLDEFLAALVDAKYEARLNEIVYERPEGWVSSFFKNLKNPGYREKTAFLERKYVEVIKYFPDRQELIALARQFIDDLFLHAARQHGKQTWCEKTPHNHLNLDFLWELFPESAVILIKRDPRGVALSLLKQHWAPHDLEEVCLYLRNVYQRWFDVRSRVDVERRCFIEIKLEDLAEAQEDVLQQVMSRLGLSPVFINPPQIKPERVNYWRQEMAPSDIQLVNRLLGPYIERIGYTV
jgi:hypothetical protein